MRLFYVNKYICLSLIDNSIKYIIKEKENWVDVVQTFDKIMFTTFLTAGGIRHLDLVNTYLQQDDKT